MNHQQHGSDGNAPLIIHTSQLILVIVGNSYFDLVFGNAASLGYVPGAMDI